MKNRLKEIRTNKNISGTKIAEFLNISPQYYYDIEKGRRKLSIELAEKIADYFDVTVDYLLGRSNHRKLTKKDEKDIEKIIEETKQKIENTEGLMLDGEILNQEDIDSIIHAMRVGLEMAKIKNKEKYGRKKKGR